MRARVLAGSAAALAAVVLGFLAAGVFAVGRAVDAAGARPVAARGAVEKVAARLLGARRDLAFGEALRLLRVPASDGGAVGASARRRQSEALLEPLAAHGRRADRSRAANLLGALKLADAASGDRRQRSETIAAAIWWFERAALVDPANEDAKYNLELLLSLESRRQRAAAAAAPSASAAERHPGAGDTGAGY